MNVYMHTKMFETTKREHICIHTLKCSIFMFILNVSYFKMNDDDRGVVQNNRICNYN